MQNFNKELNEITAETAKIKANLKAAKDKITRQSQEILDKYPLL